MKSIVAMGTNPVKPVMPVIYSERVMREQWQFEAKPTYWLDTRKERIHSNRYKNHISQNVVILP